MDSSVASAGALRIPTRLIAKARKSARRRGKSDPIDALNVARAALQEGLDAFPAAQLDGPELGLPLLVDHRERLVRHRVELNSALLWHVHDLWPEIELPGGRCSRRTAARDRPASGPRRTDDARPDRARRAAPPRRAHAVDQPARVRDHRAVGRIAPQLLSEPGFGPLIAAKLAVEGEGVAVA